jgi:hypothetical protein
MTKQARALFILAILLPGLLLQACGSPSIKPETSEVGGEEAGAPHAGGENTDPLPPTPAAATLEPTLLPLTSTPLPPTVTPLPPTETPLPLTETPLPPPPPTLEVSPTVERPPLGGPPPATEVAVNPDAPTPDESGALPYPADAHIGDILFHTYQPVAGYMCGTCHSDNSEKTLIGPGLWNVAFRAQTRVPGQTAVDYLYTAIVQPSAYVVEDFSDLMPKNWGQVYTEAEIYDIIAYLLTLHD